MSLADDNAARHNHPMRTLATLVLAAVSLTACSRSKGGEEMKTPPTVARVGPTCDSLRSAGDDLLPQQAFMPLIDVIYRDGEKPRYGELTDPQRALVYTWHLEGEVNNGGFNQYFFNGGGETIDGAIQGFLFYGATEHSALAERARALFEKDAPRVEAARTRVA